jgi:NAD(P)-dependent dehydrogenase (short-subunit alcohol dehydrogenase family)
VIALAAATADEGTAELAVRLGEFGPVVLLASQHAALPGGVAFVRADLGSAEEAETAWASAESGHGPLDVLVTLPAQVPADRTPVVAVHDALWARAIRGNLLVAANAARAASRSMLGRGHGRIAMVTWRLDDAAGRVADAAASGAIGQLARALASEVGEHGVTVNAVAVPPGHLVDAVAAIRLLCSPWSGYLTSETLRPLRVAPQ